MTEYEILDVIVSRFSSMTEQASLYFALVSGYLIMAYLVGSRLSRLQVSVINGLYFVWIFGIIGGYTTTVGAVVDLESALLDLERTSTRVSNTVYAYSFAVVQVAGLLASLVFMWSVRHPRTE
jgi:hypothetical protein